MPHEEGNGTTRFVVPLRETEPDLPRFRIPGAIRAGLSSRNDEQRCAWTPVRTQRLRRIAPEALSRYEEQRPRVAVSVAVTSAV